MPNQHMRGVWVVLSLALAATSAPVFAQEPASTWPSKPITIVIGTSAGSGSDREARLYGDKLQAVFGRPFVVVHRTGASGSIAAASVAKAPPDGYTFLGASTSFSVRPAFPPALPYDIVKDFAAVSMLSTSPIVLFAAPTFPPNNLTEYIAYARANPDKILWASSGPGATNHLSGVLFHNLIKASATFVHYKGGGPAQMADMMEGRIHVHPTSLQDNAVLTHVKSGKLKAIVVLSRQRVPLLPDVRTAHEQGLTDFEQPNYFGFVAPAGTNPAIVGRLSVELSRVLKSPDVVKTLESEGARPVGSTPAEFGQYLASQVERWTRVVKENNIQQE